MTAPCRHDQIRYVLDNSAESHAQKDGVDEQGRPYRDVPMWPSATFAYARAIGSDFENRVVEMKCRDCAAPLDGDIARVSDPMPPYGRRS